MKKNLSVVMALLACAITLVQCGQKPSSAENATANAAENNAENAVENDMVPKEFAPDMKFLHCAAYRHFCIQKPAEFGIRIIVVGGCRHHRASSGQHNKPVPRGVCGIPDSGVGTALGYAEGRQIPYQRAVLKYTPTWPRSFTPGNQSRRNLVAKMKLIPNKALLKGQRVVFCDDSIVRGTQLRDNVRTFFEYGAKEVHARISCPPLVYGCPFIGFTASKSDLELITRRIIQDFEGDPNKNLDKYAQTDSPEYNRMVEEIGRRLGLSSVKFSKIETLIEAIGMPKCKVCTHCFDGTSYFFEKKSGK